MENNEKTKTAASQVDAQERLKTAAIGMASNIKLHATGSGGEKGTSEVADKELVEKTIKDWPAMSPVFYINSYDGPFVRFNYFFRDSQTEPSTSCFTIS